MKKYNSSKADIYPRHGRATLSYQYRWTRLMLRSAAGNLRRYIGNAMLISDKDGEPLAAGSISSMEARDGKCVVNLFTSQD